MKIFLMRHGEASFDAPSDNARQLTENGREGIKYNIEKKRETLQQVDLLLTSPILRAKQTAEIAHKILQRSDSINEVDWLVHGSDPMQSIMALSQYSVDSVLLFSHQPFVSYFIVALCGLDEGGIAMNTASIVAMEADPIAADFGKVLWHLN